MRFTLKILHVLIMMWPGIISTLFSAQDSFITSPNGAIEIEFFLKDQQPFYSVQRYNKPVVYPSLLGFEFKDTQNLDSSFQMNSCEKKTVDETWTQPWGEFKDIRNHYNQLVVHLEQKSGAKLDIVFRAFDDGIGFRYFIPKQKNLDSLNITNELTQFNLKGNHSVWWQGAYLDNRYEYLYQNSPLKQIDSVHTPLTMETESGLYLCFHEAALTDYSSMTLVNSENNVLKADLVPWSDGIRVKTKTPLFTPWRTIVITETPNELITSSLVLNLNEPSKLSDVSWIKPGKYVGIWWEMHLNKSTWGSGPQHGATTANAVRYIDFAAENGFDGVLIEGWNTGWDGDWITNNNNFNFTRAHPDFDIEQVVNYARSKGVAIIGHHETGGGVMNYEKQLIDAFDFYEKLGILVVKTGYVNYGRGIKRVDENGELQGEYHHGQYMVRHYRRVVEEAAKHHIMLDVHEPIKDTGIRRTWPNMMTREGSRGQEFNAWSPDGGNPPDHTTLLPFTRMLAGPMDFTPGIFDLLFEKEKPDNRVNTTLAKQLALYVVLYSPLQMAADLPENYLARPKPFQFIKDVPTDWARTIVPHAKIGDYITVARQDRNSQDWYIGSITDEQGRSLELSFSFLLPDTEYNAEIYRDSQDADWKTNPYGMEIEQQTINNNSQIIMHLAPGGGQAIRLTPINTRE